MKMRRTLVVVEVKDEMIRNVSFEALSAAQKIDSAEITAIVLEARNLNLFPLWLSMALIKST